MLILTISVILLFYYLLFSNVGFSRQPKHYAFMLRNPNEINLRKLLIGGIQAAQMGGVEVLAVSHDIKAKSKGQTKEGVNDPVTNADLRSHCVMEQGLKRLFSKVTIISEEDALAIECPDVNHFELDPTVIDEDIQLADDYVVPAEDVTVWIDPLDATQEYTGEILFCLIFHFNDVLSHLSPIYSQLKCLQKCYFNTSQQWFVWRSKVNQSSESFTIHSPNKRFGRGKTLPSLNNYEKSTKKSYLH